MRRAYTYTVTDGDGAVRLTFSITIQEDRMPAFSGAIAAQIYTAGAAITALTLPAATGGDRPLQYSLTPPDGMTFKEDTRELSGAPTTEAVATDYTLTARDEDGDTEEFVFSVTVRAANATPITLPSKTLNVTSVSTSDATTMLTSTVAWEAAASGGWITGVDPAMETGDEYEPSDYADLRCEYGCGAYGYDYFYRDYGRSQSQIFGGVARDAGRGS